MADGSFPTLISKDRLPNSVTNEIFVGVSDGTDQLLITAAGEITIDAISTSVTPGTGAANLGKAVDDAAGATDTVVAVGAIRDDVLTTLTPVDGDYVNLRVNSTGALHVTASSFNNDAVLVDDAAFTVGTSSVSASGFLADETAPDSVDEGDIGAARMTLDRRQLFVLTDATTESQRLEINAAGQAQVDVAAHALTNANAVPVSKDNSANSSSNPIFVQEVTTGVSADEVHDYDTAAAVAGDATSIHTYTTVNTTFLLKQIVVGASGGMKYEVQVDSATILVGFIPRRGGMDTITLAVPDEAGTDVDINRTNRQGAAQDVYSTIIGNDV